LKIDTLLNSAIVFDIETYAKDANGKEINIKTDFEKYLQFALVKWVGIYSFRENKEYYLEVSKDKEKIKELMDANYILIGFNNEEFDYPIMVNNGLANPSIKRNHVDCMKILGANSFRDKNGYKYKGRGGLMDYTFKRNSLKCMAEAMKLEVQKGDIDYKIFKKDIYTDEEREDIVKYLSSDVMATKEMFSKLWNYWMPFTELIDWKYVQNLSWIKSSIASLIYKSACFQLNVEPTYSEKNVEKTEEMGGRVLLPKYEEARSVWYVDFASLYPHIFTMFNLFNEVDENTDNAWHGNDMFNVRGYYNISHKHKLSKVIAEKLRERIDLKKKDKNNSMVYTLKIWLNGLYGVARSALFEQVHTKNCGWDCCWLGQQIHEFTQKELEKYGFEAVYGDTDSVMVVSKDDKHLDRDYIETCLKKIVEKILVNVPFPVDTFDIDIENFIPYMLFPFSEQECVEEDIRKKLNKKIVEGHHKEEIDGKTCIIREEDNKVVKNGRSWVKERMGRKKNYLYLYKDDEELNVKIVGLPIKKANATQLGMKIYNEVLEPLILENKSAKFSKEFIDNKLEEYLKHKEILRLLSREFKIKPAVTYKAQSSIYAQISNGYFNGGEGVINLIKNKKVGNAGKGDRYCTLEEAIESKLTVKDLDLEKIMNEIDPFIKYEKNLTK